MRTVEEFKRDQQQWKQQSEKKHAIRLLVGWIIAIVVMAVLAAVGVKAYKTWKEDSAKPKPPGASTQEQPTGN